MSWYWIDTRWGCGGIEVSSGIVIASAPIFRRFIGQRLTKLQRSYRILALENEDAP